MMGGWAIMMGCNDGGRGCDGLTHHSPCNKLASRVRPEPGNRNSSIKEQHLQHLTAGIRESGVGGDIYIYIDVYMF